MKPSSFSRQRRAFLFISIIFMTVGFALLIFARDIPMAVIIGITFSFSGLWYLVIYISAGQDWFMRTRAAFI